jgi:phosphoserine phosphatase
MLPASPDAEDRMDDANEKRTNVNDVSTEKKLQDLQEILEISKAMTIEKDFDRLIDLIVDAANRVMEAERSSLYVYEPETEELWTKIAHGTERFRVKVGTGISGQVAQDRSIINVVDADTDPRHFKGIDQKSGFHTKSILCGPLLNHEGRLIGVLQVLNKKTAPHYFSQYDEELLKAFSSHIAVTLDQARLFAEYVQKQKLEHDLELAREVQQGLLPTQNPNADRFDIYGWSNPCDATGGDYYDYVDMEDGELGILVADVTGHGIGPALLMVEARAFARATATMGGNLDRLMCAVNDLLSADLAGGKFVTCFWGLLNKATGRLQYSSAGHGHAVLFRAHDCSLEELDSTAPPLGIAAGMEFPLGPESTLNKGDVLLITTDGIEEAMNPAGETFGRERLRSLLCDNTGGPASQIAQIIRDDVNRFMDGADQRDDLTMIVVKALA